MVSNIFLSVSDIPDNYHAHLSGIWRRTTCFCFPLLIFVWHANAAAIREDKWQREEQEGDDRS